jgi:hypothetical protein
VRGWLPSMVGAAIVVLAGLAVGVAVEDGESGGAGARKPIAGDSRDPGTPFAPAEDEDWEYLRDIEPTTAQDIFPETKTAKIGRRAYPRSVVIELDHTYYDVGWFVDFAVPSEDVSVLAGTFGLSPDTSSEVGLELEIRKDSKTGPVLYRKEIADPSDIAADIRVPLRGAVKVVFCLSLPVELVDSDTYIFPGGHFVLGTARFEP